jgi:serine/threonine-protein kinase
MRLPVLFTILCCASCASCGGVRDAGSTDGGASDMAAAPGADLCCGQMPGPDGGKPPMSGFFPPGAPWTQDVSKAPLDAESATIIKNLVAAGGWGTPRMHIDYSIEVLRADGNAPFRAFTKTADFYEVECDHVPVPVPPVGALEGEAGYRCTRDGDCHLIVVHEPTRKLYEMWRADIVDGNTFRGGCLAVWDLNRIYPPTGRGKDCSSADAAGLPIAPLLFTADEVKAGAVNHAIRFALPNPRIRKATYVAPGSHATRVAGGGPGTIPYGARIRLRADFPMQSLPNEGARTLARAMQKYGMFLSDGGNLPLMGQSDKFTKAKWDGLLGVHDMGAILVSDFEVVELGPRITWNGDCVRNP